MYTCGLTVYARGHIGNFRTFVSLDVLRRAMKYEAGSDMRQVMTFTDVADRTTLESQKAGVPLREYTSQYIDAYRQDAVALGLEPVEETPRATDAENLAAMGDTIQALERNGHTYRSDGSIYFKISTLPDYGKLAHLDHSGIKSGARIDSDKYDKENAATCAVEGHEGRGADLGFRDRPGGPAGISMLRHGAAAARSRRSTSTPEASISSFPSRKRDRAERRRDGPAFSRFWVHVEHLMIDTGSDEKDKGSEKMSKSLGNVYNLKDVVDRGFRPSALRYLYLGVHYRKQLKFSWSAMAQSEEALTRLTDFLARLETLPARDRNPAIDERLREAVSTFSGHILDDVNTAASIGVMFDLVRALNSAIDAGELGAADGAAVRAAFERFDKVLGILALRRAEDARPPVPVDEIEQLIEAVRAARLARNFAEADRIRKDLDARGILLEDTGSITRWKRK